MLTPVTKRAAGKWIPWCHARPVGPTARSSRTTVDTTAYSSCNLQLERRRVRPRKNLEEGRHAEPISTIDDMAILFTARHARHRVTVVRLQY